MRQTAEGKDVSQRDTIATAVHTLEGILPQLPGPQQGPLQHVIHSLREAAQAAEAAAVDQEAETQEERSSVKLHAWGQRLRERREITQLTRLDVARYAGVSETTIKNLELGYRPPSPMLLRRLLAVSELGLSETLKLKTSDSEGPTLNCWLAPGFEPLKMLKELVMLVNGRGGKIEQSYMYLDHMSAVCWCNIADLEVYSNVHRSMPLDRAAAQILACAGGAGVDVLGLGCGDGKLEVQLVQNLLWRVEHGDLRFFLLDISQPLLAVAYKHAMDTLADRRGVSVTAIQGNFHHLPCYTQLHYAPQRAHRRRVICMLGGTFGNLDDEIQFVRNSLVGFAPGDLLLLDINLAYAPLDQPQEIAKKDPRLSGQLPESWRIRGEEFLAGPLKRYGKRVTGIRFESVLDTHCCVPGSYAVEIVAKVESVGIPDRRFSMFRIKRHDLLRLIDCLRQLGWDPVDGLRFGDDPDFSYLRVLYLFRRRDTR